MNKRNNDVCIVHYSNQSSYSTLKRVSEIIKERLIDAKKKKEEVGGNNHHMEQSNQIPDEIQVNSHHIHMEPCYKRFVS